MKPFRNLAYFGGAFLGAVLLLTLPHVVHAQTAGSNAWGSWSYESFGGQSRAVLTPTGGGASTYVPLGSSSVGTVAARTGGGVTASMPVSLTLSSAGKPSTAALLTAQRVATAQQIARGALSALSKGPAAVPTAALLLAPSAIQWANDQWQKSQTPAGAPPVVTGGDWFDPTDSCTRLAVGQVGINKPGPNSYEEYRIEYPPNAPGGGFQPVNNCTNRPAQNGQFPVSFWRVVQAPYVGPTETVPVTEQQLESALEQGLASSPASAPSVVQEIIGTGGTIEASAPTVTGPASISTPVKTVTTASGSTTSNTTYNITYNNNSVGYTTTTTTTTKDAAGNTTGTETETTEPDPEDIKVTASDPSMPIVPKLYTQKYPDGIAGVWTQKKAALSGTGYVAALDALMPDIPDGSGCPQFSIPGGNLAGFSFGAGSIGPPCIVWPFIKAVVVISSLFLARSLIFGG